MATVSKKQDGIYKITKILKGVILGPPDSDSLEGAVIEAFIDAELKKSIGSTTTDSKGRFQISAKSLKQHQKLWFKWKFKRTRGQSPRLNPWIIGTALRIACYDLKKESRGGFSKKIQGSISGTTRQPSTEYKVQLVEQTAQYCHRLSQATSDKDGSYVIPYNPDKLIQTGSPDLRVIVLDSKGKPLLESTDTGINLPDQFIRSSWVNNAAVKNTVSLIKREFSGKSARGEDVDYLIKKRTLPADQVILLRKAGILASHTGLNVDVALTIESAGSGVAIETAIHDAIEAGFIDSDNETNINLINDTIEEYHYRTRRQLPDDYPTLQSLFVHRLGDNEELRLTAANLFRESKNDYEMFEELISENINLKQYAQDLRFTVELSEKVYRHLPLIQKLESEYENGHLITASTLGGWEIAEWKQFIIDNEIEIPDEYQIREDIDRSIHSYARTLRNIFENAYPDSAIRTHISKYTEEYSWGVSLNDFLKANNGIDSCIPVAKLERENKELFTNHDGQEVRNGLATIQRLRNITNSIDPIPRMIKSGLSSAKKIGSYSRHHFIKTFQSDFDNSAQLAREIHDRAIKATSIVSYAYSEFSEQFNKTPIAALKNAAKSAKQQQAIASWREIFGERDVSFCNCSHCKSIFGPAAYLYDMLLYLERFSTPSIKSNEKNTGSKNSIIRELNKIESADDLAAWVKDDPEFKIGSNKAIGIRVSLAKRIIDKRNDVGGEFTSLDQIVNVKGLGKDTLHDILVTSWGDAAVTAYSNALEFINTVSDANKLQQRIIVDPEFQTKSDTKEVISLSKAQNIIDVREQYPSGYSSMRQLGEIKGIGSEILHHIAYSFFKQNEQSCSNISWTEWGQQLEPIKALETVEGRLYGVTEDNRLVTRPTQLQSVWWQTLGKLPPAKSLAIKPGKIYFSAGNGINEANFSSLLGEEEVFSQVEGNITAIACSSASIFVVADHTLYGVDLDRKFVSWTDLGDAGDIHSMTVLNGMLYAMAKVGNKNALKNRVASLDSVHNWSTEIGQPALKSISSVGSYLYGVDNQNKVYVKDNTSELPLWNHVVDIENTVLLKRLGNFYYRISSGGQLYIVEQLHEFLNESGFSRNWIYLTTMNNVSDFAGWGNSLFVSRGNTLYQLDNLPREEECSATVIDDTSNIKDFTIFNNRYFLIQNNGNLISRVMTNNPDNWQSSGIVQNVKSITVTDNQVFVINDDYKLLMRPVDQDHLPWVEVGSDLNIHSLASFNTTLFSISDDNKLWLYQIPISEQEPELNTLIDRFRLHRPDVPALPLTCDNTNIEVPHIDLVNELLSDFISNTLCAGFSNISGSSARITTGTSEERLAWPEYMPAVHVMEALQKATYPWTLPYDYQKDRAKQAIKQLGINESEVLQLISRLQSLMNNNSNNDLIDTASLGRYFLQLSDAEVELLTSSYTDLEMIWGKEVASSVNSGFVTVKALQNAGRFEETSDSNSPVKVFFPSLEAALESEFVRGGHDISLNPAGACNPVELHISLPQAQLSLLLNRLYRFERLRRVTGWTVDQIDILLAELGYNLNEDTLTTFGLMLHLQECLKIETDELLALFIVPTIQRPFTLRKEKEVRSIFERLFNISEVQLPPLPNDESEYRTTEDFIIATISERVATGPDEIRFVFENNFVGTDTFLIKKPLEIILDGVTPRDAKDAQILWRAGVAAVNRLLNLADAFSISLKELVALLKLFQKQTLFVPKKHDPLLSRIENALQLTDLYHQVKNWSLSITELLYIVSDNYEANRQYGLDVNKSGILIHRLHREIQAIIDKNQVDITNPELALHEALQLHMGWSPSASDALESSMQQYLSSMSRMIEWSAYNTTLIQQAIEKLPVDSVLNPVELEPDNDEHDEAERIVNQSLESIAHVFRRHITSARNVIGNTEPVDDQDSDYIKVLKEFREFIKSALTAHQPDYESFAKLIISLIWSNPHIQGISRRAERIAETMLNEGIDFVYQNTEDVRTSSMVRWVNVLHRNLMRGVVKNRLLEILADSFSIELLDARKLLEDLLIYENKPLINKFIDDNGKLLLDNSLVNATYNSKDNQFSVQRLEPSLQMDWAEFPPPENVDSQSFTVTLDAELQLKDLIKVTIGNQGALKKVARNLIVETTGDATMHLVADDTRNLLEINEGGRLQRLSWDRDAALQIIENLSNNPETCKVSFTISFSKIQPSGEIAQLPLFSVLIETDYEEIPLSVGIHTAPLMRFDKAARIIKNTHIPGEIWKTVHQIDEPRRIDLNQLFVNIGNSLGLWLQITSLDSIWKRSKTDSVKQSLTNYISGVELTLSEIATSLVLSTSEYSAIEELFNQSNTTSNNKKDPPCWYSFDTAIQVAETARNLGLPFIAIINLIKANSIQIYQWCLAAIQTSKPEEKYYDVLQVVHNPVRENLRDALVSWLITHHRQQGGSMLPPFEHAEAISRFLYTDIQMSSCMVSSRVQFAYAAVQRFIDSVRLGYETGIEDPEEQELFEREWTWRRFYRLWEANRRVFAYPENWLEPDLRPEKTQFFQEFEEELMEGPLTTESAENAIANYLGKLVEVARPEIIGLVHEEGIPDANIPLGFRDPELQGTHVFARSRSQPQQLYYRRRLPDDDKRWTPWERIEADLPGEHFVPVIAFRKLYLISAEFGQGKTKAGICERKGNNLETDENEFKSSTHHMVLSWIERKHGSWSKVKRSETLEFQQRPHEFIEYLDNNSKWIDDFPVDRFQTVTYADDDSLKANEVAIEVTFGIDGIENGYMHVFLVLYGDTPDIYLGTIGYTKPHNKWNEWKEGKRIYKSLGEEKNISDIRGFYFMFNTSQALIGPGDVAIIKRVNWSLKNSNTGNIIEPPEPIEEASDFTGLRMMCNDAAKNSSYLNGTLGGAHWLLDIQITENEHIVNWDSNEVIDCFQVKIPAESVDTSALALHSSKTTGNSSLALLLQQTQGANVSASGKVYYRFNFEEYNGEHKSQLEKAWTDEWVPGENPKPYCLPYTTEEEELLRIELFSDGTVQAKQVIEEQNQALSTSQDDLLQPILRGEYRETIPSRQNLVGEFPSEEITVMGGTYQVTGKVNNFYLKDTMSFYTPELENPYTLIVENRNSIVYSNSPKILELQPTHKNGETLFIEKDNNLSSTIDDWEFWFAYCFWHPQASGFSRLLHSHGISQLLQYSTQTLSNPELDSEKQAINFIDDYYFHLSYVFYEDLFHPQYKGADVLFNQTSPYADYNWELFFHAPLLIAQRLSTAGRYEDAERWFTLLFDPSKGRLNNDALSCFQTRPLREWQNERLEDLLYSLENQDSRERFEEQVDRLNRNPYQPHLIARSRISAYQKTLVMKYLDHLFAWGDEMFRRAYAGDNRTELEIASSRFDLIASILGPRPEPIPAANLNTTFSFDTLSAGRDDIENWDPVVRMEDYLSQKIAKSFQNKNSAASGPADQGDVDTGGVPDSSGDTGNNDSGSIGGADSGYSGDAGGSLPGPYDDNNTMPGTGNVGSSGFSDFLYFCIPHNDILLRYWDQLADRLWKLRSCRDIEGVRRTLSLYGRQIDPGLLVRATAMGLDIDMLLGYLSTPLSTFRFQSLLQRAKSACDRAQGFGQSLLSTIEKKESEELSRLRSRHELKLLRATKELRRQQVEEARSSLESLEKSRESAEARFQFYSTRERLSSKEKAEGKLIEKATEQDREAASASSTAVDLAFIPNFPIHLDANASVWAGSSGYGYEARLSAGGGNSYDFGGSFLSKIAERKAQTHRHAADYLRAESSRLSRQASFDRRWDDWQLQKDLAQTDMEQIDKQIASAEIRLRITEIEQENQQLQIDQAATVDAYLRDKFTNAKLYRWLETRLSRLHYQQYRLAYDMALKAQRALRFELGIDDNALLPDTWDPSHRGLEAAADLQHELEKMENQYYEQWRREHEKQKVFSLVTRWPIEFLELRQTGSCIIRILESDLDEDEPGDYYRRIKQVSLTIPCVKGPDISINARLTLLRSEIRIKSGGDYPRTQDNSSSYFRDEMGGEHIVTNTAMNDTGQLDTGANNDKRAPFEGWGAISTWQIDLDEETNFFDRTSISDVKLTVAYTARDGGPIPKATAITARNDRLQEQGCELMLPLDSYFSNAWSVLVSKNNGDKKLSIKLSNNLLPDRLKRKGEIDIVGASLCLSGITKNDISISNPDGNIYELFSNINNQAKQQIIEYRLETSPAIDDTVEVVIDSLDHIPDGGWFMLYVKAST